MTGSILFFAIALLLPLPCLFAMALLIRRKRAGKQVNLLLANVVVLLLLLSLCLPCGEAYYRFIYDRPDPYGVTIASQRWFERHFQYNTFGFRDSLEYSLVIAPGKRRVSFLGDSFTAGHGIDNVDDTLPQLVRTERGIAWELHNISIIGNDTPQQLNLLTQMITAGYELDTVVLMYCLNDIAALMPEYQQALKTIYGQKDKEGWLLRNSFMINTLYYRFSLRDNPEVADYYSFISGGYETDAWSTQQAALRSLAQKCKDAGAELLVVTFPFMHALDDGYEYQFIHDLHSQFWDSIGVPNLDLTPIYSAHPARSLTVSPFDAHPNEFAIQLAAEPITRFIELHMVPSR